MKKYCLLFCLIYFALPALAQTRNTKAISIGAELDLPQRSRYNIGYGAWAKFELPVTQTVSLALTAGFNQYHTKTIFNNIGGNNDTYVPLKAGVKYYFDPRFYTEGELGTVLDHNNGSSQNLFTYSLGTGILIPLKNSTQNMIDIGVRYEDWSQNRLQQFAIKVGYRFGW